MTTKANEKRHIIAAYIMDEGAHTLNRDDAFKLTHVNYSFALVHNDEVVGSHLKNLDMLNEFKKINPELQTIISVGGWSAGGFSEAASTPEGREKFADTAVDFMRSNNFDGIDIDWEYPCSSAGGIVSSPDDKHNFTLMIKELREKLDLVEEKDNRKYLLTIAAGAGQSFVDGTEMDIVQKYLDYVNIMTYDMRGFDNTTGHHTNLYAQTGDPDGMSGDKAVKILVAAGVPIEKIVYGAAFYGRSWKNVENSENGLTQKGEVFQNPSLSYTVLREKYINKNGFTRYWDDNAKAPYLFNGDQFITYDDEESLGHKAQYIKLNNLAGIMFWQYASDTSYTLVDKLYRELG